MGLNIEPQRTRRDFRRGLWTRYVWFLNSLITGQSDFSSLQRDKRFSFEDPKPSSSNLGVTALSAQEWLDALDRAKEMALTQHNNGAYSGDETFRDLSSGMSSHSNTLDRSSEIHAEAAAPPGRATLVKHQATDSESVKGRKRFSRRHSKNGLAAVF